MFLKFKAFLNYVATRGSRLSLCWRLAPAQVAVISILMAGCGLFGGDQDQGVLRTTHYRKSDPACAQLNLSTSTLTVKDFRDIFHCFASTTGDGTKKTVSPIQRLVDQLEDHQLLPLVEALNKYILNDPKMLFKMESSIYSANQRKVGEFSLLDSSLIQFGKLLENADFITNSIALLKEGRVRSASGEMEPDPELLKAFELIAKEMTYDFWIEALDFGSNISSAPAFQGLQAHFTGPSPSGRSLREVTESLYTYLMEPHTYECEPGNWVDIKLLLQQAVLDEGDHLSHVLNQLLGTDPAQIRQRVPRLASVFQATLKSTRNQPPLMSGLVDAFSALNHNISCLYGGQSINGAMHLIRELNEPENLADPEKYILVSNRLNMAALAPLCDFPPRLDDYYRTLTSTVETGVMPNMTELLRVLYQDRGLHWKGCDGRSEPQSEFPLMAQLFVNFLGDSGRHPETGVSTGGARNLISTLQEFTDRNAWVDLLLVMALPNDADQRKIQVMTQFLMRPLEELGGKSVLDVVMKAVSRTSPERVFQLARSLSKFMDHKDPLLAPALASLRSAYYVNDVHPFLDLVHETMAHASENVAFYNTVFLISDHPDFAGSIQVLSDMAKDGSLKDLVLSTVKIFHRFAEQGRIGIAETPEPPLVISRRHELKWTRAQGVPSANRIQDLALTRIAAIQLRDDLSDLGVNASGDGPLRWYTEDCRDLNPSFSPVSTQVENYDVQLQHYWRCLEAASGRAQGAGDPPHVGVGDLLIPGNLDRSIQNSFQFLTQQRTDRVNGDNKSYLDFTLELSRRLFTTQGTALTPDEMSYLIQAGLRAYHAGEQTEGDPATPLMRLLNAVPLMIEGPPPVLQPLLDVAGSVMVQSRGAVQALEAYAGGLLESPQFPQVLHDVRGLLKQERLDAADPIAAAVDHQNEGALDELFPDQLRIQIRQMVVDWECDLVGAQIDNRVQEIIDEAKHSVSSWDLVGGHPRRSWDLESIQTWENPVLQKITNPIECGLNSRF